jgi:hypothetical protein
VPVLDEKASKRKEKQKNRAAHEGEELERVLEEDAVHAKVAWDKMNGNTIKSSCVLPTLQGGARTNKEAHDYEQETALHGVFVAICHALNGEADYYQNLDNNQEQVELGATPQLDLRLRTKTRLIEF